MSVELNISVRDLVAFVLTAGDLTHTFSGPSRAAEAIRAHQRIQAARPADYQPEVGVSHTVNVDGVTLHIGGRMDGLWPRKSGLTVEEIKTTRRKLKPLIAERNPLHWGQAKAYAYLYAREHGLDAVDVQLTYHRLPTKETESVRETFPFVLLEAFFDDLVACYIRWAKKLSAARRRRDERLAALAFPYPRYRQGQREMAVAAYRTVRDRGRLMVQAATGIGKTLGVLFPALKALGEAHTAKIFFLAARTTGKMAAEQALAILRENGLVLKSLTLTAKDKICPQPVAVCTAEECPRAKGHFDRLGAARGALFAEDIWNREAVEAVAEAHCVCPFELSLDAALWADCIICDYNYAFDPRVNLKRFFAEPEEDYTFLVDEAHNLVDRSREMFSASLNKESVLAVRRAVGKKTLPGVYRSLSGVNNWLLKARRECEDAGTVTRTAAEPPAALEQPLRQFLKSAESWLEKNKPAAFRTPLLELYFAVHNFLRVLEQFDETYAALTTARGKDLSIKLFCLDPAAQMREAWRRCKAVVLFSATLSPGDYFQTVLGLDPQLARLRLPSPFPVAHFQPLLMDSVSTYYKERAKTVSAVARAIEAAVRAKPGNYLVFGPSYAYLGMIHEAFCQIAQDIPTTCQTVDLDEKARSAFVDQFQAGQDRTLVGFAVLGGIFGEGIDLKGERLVGVVVVGVGLPGICPERDLIRNYYEGAFQAGFEYAYQYPGINRVLQAAGRVIRTAADRGLVLLVDRRYGTARYRNLLPPEWRLVRTPLPANLTRAAGQFWNGAER
ncbi:MAG: ATP-dependent DNA helicase [Desulfobacterales bacterium]